MCSREEDRPLRGPPVPSSSYGTKRLWPWLSSPLPRKHVRRVPPSGEVVALSPDAGTPADASAVNPAPPFLLGHTTPPTAQLEAYDSARGGSARSSASLPASSRGSIPVASGTAAGDPTYLPPLCAWVPLPWPGGMALTPLSHPMAGAVAKHNSASAGSSEGPALPSPTRQSMRGVEVIQQSFPQPAAKRLRR